MAGIRESLLGLLETEKDLWRQRIGLTEFLSSPQKTLFESYISFIDMVSHDVRSFKCIYYFDSNRYEEELCINPLWSPMNFIVLLNEQLMLLKDRRLERIELQYLNSFRVIYNRD